MRCDVTIGIPLYNSCDYILQTMQSVLEQTYSYYEVLVVDDCSNDGSLDIVKELQISHPLGNKIRLLFQSSNMGVSAARNRIIDEASGKYLYFLDSDDLIFGKETITIMISHAQRIGADVVFGSYLKKWVDGSHEEYYRYEQHDFVNEDSFAQYAYRKYGGVQASACNCLMNLNLIRQANIRFFDATFLEDYMFINDLLPYVLKVVTLSDVTYCYQFHENSLSHIQHREIIPKQEIVQTIQGVDFLKKKTKRLLGKSYYSSRMCNLLKTDFYVLCSILRNKKEINPSFSSSEMKEAMSCPLPFRLIINGKYCKPWNLFFYLMDHMPPALCVFVIKNIGKMKGLV